MKKTIYYKKVEDINVAKNDLVKFYFDVSNIEWGSYYQDNVIHLPLKLTVSIYIDKEMSDDCPTEITDAVFCKMERLCSGYYAGSFDIDKIYRYKGKKRWKQKKN